MVGAREVGAASGLRGACLPRMDHVPQRVGVLVMGQLSRLLAAPRYTLLGCGILAFTLSNWLAFAVQDGGNPLATLVMLGLLALGLALLVIALVARSAPPAGDGHVADPPASTCADVRRGEGASTP